MLIRAKAGQQLQAGKPIHCRHCGNQLGNLVILPSGARAVMQLDGTLIVDGALPCLCGKYRRWRADGRKPKERP